MTDLSRQDRATTTGVGGAAAAPVVRLHRAAFGYQGRPVVTDADLNIPDTQANFVWLPLGERTEEFAGVAKDAGLVVRPFAGEGVRATIAEPEANDRLVDVVKGFVGTR